jgi:hypothetical protein
MSQNLQAEIDRLTAIEAQLTRVEKLLGMMWDQQQRSKHTPAPEPVPQKSAYVRLDEIAQRISDRHPAVRTASVDTVGRILIHLIGNAGDPEAAAKAVERHHQWRCKYEWATKEPAFIPKLFKWLQDEALSPCPTDAEGEAMLRGPERMSRAERDLLELQRENDR